VKALKLGQKVSTKGKLIQTRYLYISMRKYDQTPHLI